MESSSKIKIKKFNVKIFELWKTNMEDLLVENGQWVNVDLGTTPTSMLTKDWMKLDRKEMSTIQLSISYSVLLNVSRENISNDPGRSPHLKNSSRF